MNCPAGTALSASGATDVRACAPCPPGYTSAAGALSCAPCPVGTFSNSSGVVCTYCPLGTFGEGVGLRACTPCPTGTTTALAGASASSQCIAPLFVCPAGLQPALATPTSIADCAPLVCPPFLVQAPSGLYCEKGCAPGEAGAAGSCAPCAPDQFCPVGILPAPVVAAPLTALVAPLTPPAASADATRCVSATLAVPLLSLTPSSSVFSFLSGSALAVLGAGVALGLLALAAWCTARCASPDAPAAAAGSAPRGLPVPAPMGLRDRCGAVSTRVAGALRGVDAFSLAHTVAAGASVVSKPTPLGGACSVLCATTFLTFSALLVQRFVTANVSVVRAVDVVTADVAAGLQGVPWAPAMGGGGAVAGLSGLKLRVFSQAGAGCAGLNVLSATEAWALPAVTADCGDGRALTELVCAACAFTASSSLTFALPFTCQALHMEAVAVAATGAITYAVFNPPSAATAAASPVPALLSGAQWTLTVMSSALEDRLSGRRAKGYVLLPSPDATVSLTPLTAALVGGGAGLLPLTAAVRVTLRVSLEPTLSTITLLPSQTATDLASSIVGLAGLVGFFGALFKVAEAIGARCPRRGGDGEPAQKDGAHNAGAEAVDPELSSAASAAGFAVRTDGSEVWFENVATGALAWELPKPPEKRVRRKKHDAWKKVSDGDAVWWENRATKEVAWVVPEGGVEE